jgi:putative ABC transport system permease protein
MNLTLLAWKNIADSSFRSWVVALCALLLASFALATTLILRGVENSLRLAINRLGADIIVVPAGAETKIESALLMGIPARFWMPQETLGQIAAIPGVAATSPQLYLNTLNNAPCCSVSDMFLVAYDPTTDFTIRPWLQRNVGGALKLGEGVGGQYVFVPKGEQNIKIYGYFVTLKANMEPTGTGLDQSMFLTFDTARDIARISQTMAESPLVIPPDSISAVMVKVTPGANLHDVAVKILQTVPDVTPIESSNLFQAYRGQLAGLLRTVLVVLATTWVLSVVLIGLVFSMAANERRRELGVLRALGATPAFVLQALLVEAGLLALAGGLAGIALTTLSIYLFQKLITTSLGLPFLFPALPALLAQVGVGLLLALGTMTLAAFLPAYRISRQDPALAMRE